MINTKQCVKAYSQNFFFFLIILNVVTFITDLYYHVTDNRLRSGKNPDRYINYLFICVNLYRSQVILCMTVRRRHKK